VKWEKFAQYLQAEKGDRAKAREREKSAFEKCGFRCYSIYLFGFIFQLTDGMKMLPSISLCEFFLSLSRFHSNVPTFEARYAMHN
jgi:hypothetical protein